MDKQEAAELLIEQAQYEEDPILAEAMLLGAQSLQSIYEWIEGDLKDWLTAPPGITKRWMR